MTKQVDVLWDLAPRRPLVLSSYLAVTLGRDGWKRALVWSVLWAAAVLVCIWTIVQGFADPFAPAGHSGSMSSLPNWVTGIAGVILLPFLLLLGSELINFVMPVLGVPFAETRLGTWARKGTSEARFTPTRDFYYHTAKRFERLRLDAEDIAVGDDHAWTVGYDAVYKAFFSCRRRLLVLRVTRGGGALDLVADLSGLEEGKLADLCAFLAARVGQSARCYGFAPLSRARTALRRYDPWDCWVISVPLGKGGGGGWRPRKRWRDWRLPAR